MALFSSPVPLALVLPLGAAAKLTRAAETAIATEETIRSFRIGAVAVDGALAGVRFAQSAVALYNHKTDEAAGYLGEALLRLAGASIATIAELKAARTAKQLESELIGASQRTRATESTGICFVAGTKVITKLDHLGELASECPAAFESQETPVGDWIWPCLLVGLGALGWHAANKSKRGKAEEQSEIDVLFACDEDKLDQFCEGIDSMRSILSEREDQVAELSELLKNDDVVGAIAGCKTRSNTSSRSAVYLPNMLAGNATPARVPIASRRRTRHKSSRIGVAWMAVCLVLAGYLAFGKSVPPRSAATSSRLPSVAAAAPSSQVRSRNIEDIRPGQRVFAREPDHDKPRTTSVDPTCWKLLRLRAEERWDDGTLDDINIETLQSPEWCESVGAGVGATVPIPLDLVEMGLPDELQAIVLAIDPCPSISEGPGGVVLTTVNHLNNFVVKLTVEDSAGHREVIKPTAPHKFYSDSQATWVSAFELEPGELLDGIDGQLVVQSIERVIGVERVYNMTVEGEHVYHVSAAGVLVHNNDCAMHNIPRRVASHDAGVQIGRQYAEHALGLSETNWVNPFEDLGNFGQGFDDVMRDSIGDLWIVEFKGNSGALAAGQMGRPWVEGNIQRLILEAPLNPWGPRLLNALLAGRLRGIALRSTDGPFGATFVLGRWTY
jgi:hypothetical protein